MGASIRVCRPGDEAALALVGQATFLEAFAGQLDGPDILAHCGDQHAAGVYRQWLDDPAARVWVAEAEPGGAPVGYLVAATAALPVADPAPSDLEIKRVYLLHRFQGQRLGQRLLSEAMRWAAERGARRLLLGVYAENSAAIGFYRRHGFATVGRRRFRVGSRECDDLIMARGVAPDADSSCT